MIVVNVLEEANAVCEVCGRRIRYVHVLIDKGREVRAGAQCAERLCRGASNANRASRRTRWLRRGWITIPTTYYLKVGRTTVAVAEDLERPGWFRYAIDGHRSRRFFPSLEAAKLAAFDFLAASEFQVPTLLQPDAARS